MTIGEISVECEDETDRGCKVENMFPSAAEDDTTVYSKML